MPPLRYKDPPASPNLTVSMLTLSGDHRGDDERLGLCTEGLGCESGEMRMDEADEVAAVESGGGGRVMRVRSRRWRAEEGRRFPPPLTWLAGRRRRFLNVERGDGRVVMSEVWIERPEVFRVVREDGRLRLMIAGVEEEAAAEAEEEERSGVELGRGWRCQEVVVSGNEIPMWYQHRSFVTTA